MATSTTRNGTTWDVNDSVRLKNTVTDASGALIDPSTVKLRVVASDGTTITNYTIGGSPAIVRLSLGVYYADIPVAMVGTWHYRWETTSPATAEEGWFRVRNPQVQKIN